MRNIAQLRCRSARVKPLLLLCTGIASLLLASLANADNFRTLTPAPKAYTAECSSCHIAFPPGLMTARDWATTLTELPKHFGTDASVTPAELAEISPYLKSNAASNEERYGSPIKPPRLTKSAWFERKHVRKLPADVWINPKVKTASNCMACHQQADKGNYSEHDISVPGYPGRHW
jgi:nitrate/TMAO reductase-like tetraheme cytochrome c subunit